MPRAFELQTWHCSGARVAGGQEGGWPRNGRTCGAYQRLTTLEGAVSGKHAEAGKAMNTRDPPALAHSE
jgi:hypothetical protein